MRRIFIIDWIAVPLFFLTAFTGINLHVAGHGGCHGECHNWAVFHIVVSLLFFIIVMFHIAAHWGWYKGLVVNGMGRKSKLTLLLSIVFLLLSATGIVLLFVHGLRCSIGWIHYIIGIATTMIAVAHIAKRIPILYKSIKK
ncbi:MAG: DUF4405 domain-containing protein [Bacteroidales bacterium]|nr:DUF4405 domain-containing protein [Bacteroidales bacterium]